jgi:hypothetical protein
MISLPLARANSSGLALFPGYSIDNEINQQHKQCEQVLNSGCQSCRIDQWCKIVFDEPCFSGVASGSMAQLVLKRCQWTDPAKQFDQDAPCNTGEMQPCKPVKAQYQQATSDNKQDKRPMQEKNQVCQEIDSQLSLLCLPSENLSIR